MNTETLETKRLILRQFTLEDTLAFFEIMRDEEVNKFLPWFPLTTMEQGRNLLKKDYINDTPEGNSYAICHKFDNIPIGYIKVGGRESYDFGYGLRREFWGKGIVTEACKKVITRLKKTSMPYITATHDVKNLASGRVMEKIGMTYRYSYEEMWQPKNILVTFRMYQLDFGVYTQTYREYWDKYPAHFIEAEL